MQSILKEENPGRNRGFAVVLSARRDSTGGMQKFGQIPSARAEGQSPQVSSAPHTTDWMFLMRSGFGPLGYTTGEAGGRLVYAHGAAQVYVANGGVSDRTNTGDAPQGGDSDSH